MRTDIVVVGSGAAGLVAACAARARGLEVTLVTKSRAGLASSTTYAGGGFSLPLGSVSPADHYRKTLETGRGLNFPHMLETMVNNAAECLNRLSEFGVKVDQGDGYATVAPYSESPVATGTGLTLPLVRHAKRAGVRMLETSMVTGLFAGQNGCAGVRVLNTRTGRMSSVAAPSVIVATGGLGRLYGRTDNPVRTTGDGYVLLAELGLPLVDMEFVQFYPMSFCDPGFATWMVPLELVEHARVVNELGREFLVEAWRESGIENAAQANLYGRDSSTRAIGSQWDRGGEAWLHVEEVPEEFWQSPLGEATRRQFPRDRTAADGPVRVRPIQHYASGGVRVGEDCSTGLPGLFAAGEVTGGTDGANRVGGNALSMTIVHGFLAADSAARHVKTSDPEAVAVPDSHPGDDLASLWLAGEGEMNPRTLRQRVNRVADEYLGPVRDEKGLKEAADRLEEAEGQLRDLKASPGRSLAEAYEVRNMVILGRCVAQAALAREESRGVHFRKDHPLEDGRWLCNLEIRMENGSVTVRKI